jgi:hypothetical protein
MAIITVETGLLQDMKVDAIAYGAKDTGEMGGARRPRCSSRRARRSCPR